MHTAADQPVTTVGAWHYALPMTKVHYIPPGYTVYTRGDRRIADAPCGYPAIVGEGDPSGLVPRCVLCARWVAGECLDCVKGRVYRDDEVSPSDETGAGTRHQHETICQPCSGTGRHREVVA